MKIALIVSGVFFGIALIIIISYLHYEGAKFKEIVQGIFMAFIIGLLPLMIYAIATYDGSKDKDKIWNDGKCPTCNTQWEFVNGSTWRGDEQYFYKCPKCKKVISVDNYGNVKRI